MILILYLVGEKYNTNQWMNYLVEGDEFYIVEYKDRTKLRGVPGGWASDIEVKSIDEFREKLSVKKSLEG